MVLQLAALTFVVSVLIDWRGGAVGSLAAIGWIMLA